MFRNKLTLVKRPRFKRETIKEIKKYSSHTE